MILSIYDYKDYKTFLNDWLKIQPNKGRGQKVLLAKALRCQTPFISHVLSGDYHFSVEQAVDCAKWLAFDEEATDFLLRLVLKARAGNRETEAFFEKQLQKKRSTQTELKKRLKISSGLSVQDQNQYYSSWHYSALHMALLNPKLQSIAELQKYFQLSSNQINKILDFLVQTKLVEISSNGKVKHVTNQLHLERNSFQIISHHTNWRLHAIEKIKEGGTDNLHYSSVVSMAHKDYDWIKTKISLLLEEVLEKIKPSPDEKLAAISFDCFEI